MPARGFSLQMAPRGLVQAMGIDTRVQRGLFSAANQLKEDWRAVLNVPGSGQVYDQALRTITVGGKSRVVPVGFRPRHRASRPGEAPAPDTARLRNSIGIDDSVLGQRVRVGSDDFIARILQWGMGPGLGSGPHPAGIVIRPRPHADQALGKAKEAMQFAFRLEVRLPV